VQPRPAPLFSIELFAEPFARGFRESTSRYGLLLDYNESRFVNGFWYLTPRMVAPEQVPARLATLATVWEQRPWRADLEVWDQQIKPAAIEANRRLQQVDPSALDAGALAAHLARCREHVMQMLYQSMRFAVPALLPVGDLLVRATDWSGLPPAQVIGLLRGASPVSTGASSELERLIAAIRGDDASLAALGSGPAERALEALCGWPGEVGAAARAYLDLVGYRLLSGWDIGQPYALELPEVLIKAIGSLVGAGKPSQREAEDLEQTAAEVRAQVPQSKRGEFDELVGEARRMYRLRDERTVFTWVWGVGLTRRAVLVAGRRLAEAGTIEQPEHLVEAGWAEMRSLLAGRPGPPAPELAARAAYRRDANAGDAPARLGPEPEPPPPPEGLPEAAIRALRAMRAGVEAMFTPSDEPNEARVLRGHAASPGAYEGRARVIADPAQLGRLQPGDVLVASATSEGFNVALPLVGAIVTDWGGLLSHAAIVSREIGIPCVVGMREATSTIPDGARVRVDGTAGEVAIL
jgi:pyruvate,water dikinase